MMDLVWSSISASLTSAGPWKLSAILWLHFRVALPRRGFSMAIFRRMIATTRSLSSSDGACVQKISRSQISSSIWKREKRVQAGMTLLISRSSRMTCSFQSFTTSEVMMNFSRSRSSNSSTSLSTATVLILFAKPVNSCKIALNSINPVSLKSKLFSFVKSLTLFISLTLS